MNTLQRQFPGATGFCWTIEHDVRIYTGEYAPRTYADTSIEALHAIHPRLAELIELKAKGYNPKPHSRVYLPFSIFEPDFKLWSGATVAMKDIIGFPKIISSIDACTIEPTNTIVKFDVELYETEDWWPNAEPQPVPHVARVYKTTMAVPRAALDRDYPGWHARFVQGEALGLDGSTQLRHVLSNGPAVQSMPMSDIHFE